MTSDLFPAARPAPCPICEHADCSLAHVYDRLIAPAVNTGARVLSRLCLLLALLVVFAMAMGWTR